MKIEKGDTVKVVAEEPVKGREGKTYGYDGKEFEILSILDTETALVSGEHTLAFEERIKNLELVEEGKKNDSNQ